MREGRSQKELCWLSHPSLFALVCASSLVFCVCLTYILPPFHLLSPSSASNRFLSLFINASSLPVSPPPRLVRGNTHAPSAPLPLHPHPPLASGPRSLLSSLSPSPFLSPFLSSATTTSPDTDTLLFQSPQSQLWSQAPSAQGKMDRGEARREGEERSILHPEINKPWEGAAWTQGTDGRE